MYELHIADKSNLEVQLAKEILGGFNQFPPGWEEIPMEEYVKLCSGPFLPTYLDYRQMWLDKLKGPCVSAILQIHRDFSGFALIPDHMDQTLAFYKFDGFKKLKEMFKDLPILSDTGWELDKRTSLIHRGITDFNRSITFERTLTDKELCLVKIYLLRDNCPGWTGIATYINGNIYMFRTTYDSSD